MGYFSVADFQSWNVGVNCTGLVVGDFYCVAHYTASNLPMPSTVTVKPSPVQTGMTTGCTAWYLATFGDSCATIPQIFGTFLETDFLSWNPALGGTACSGLVPGDYYCVASTSFLSFLFFSFFFFFLSPFSLPLFSRQPFFDCLGLWTHTMPGTLPTVSGTPKTRTSTVSTTTLPSNGVGPQPQQTGISASCSKYWLVSPSVSPAPSFLYAEAKGH